MIGLRVKLVSFDSMGVRSMATLVETKSGLIFIDPGAALAPYRYGLPPHEVELKALEESLSRIYEYISQSDYVIITHYHRDHYLYRNGEEEYYTGKILYIKHPTQVINHSQRVRAYVLLKKRGVENKARRIIYADGVKLHLDNVTLEFSRPLPHGECNTRLGWVLVVTIIEDNYVFMHASDTQGCICRDTLRYIVSKKPDYLVISGPPKYLGLDKIPEETIELVKSMKPGSTLVIDHHLLRDRNYRVFIEALREVNKDVKVTTAAEYMGLEVKQLEAYRDELWKRGY